jgi:cell division protein FtsL
MTRVSLALLLVLVLSALALVTSQHHARKLFIDLESEQVRAAKLEEEHRQLKLEHSTWSSARRVSEIAQKDLGMRMPDAATTVIVAESRRSRAP